MKSLSRSRRAFTLIEITIVTSIFAIVIAIATPGMLRARSQGRMKACQENLSKIDSAKQQMALERNLAPDHPVSIDDLIGAEGSGYLQGAPIELTGGGYSPGSVGGSPTCSTTYPGHSLEEIGQAIAAVTP